MFVVGVPDREAVVKTLPGAVNLPLVTVNVSVEGEVAAIVTAPALVIRILSVSLPTLKIMSPPTAEVPVVVPIVAYTLVLAFQNFILPSSLLAETIVKPLFLPNKYKPCWLL